MKKPPTVRDYMSSPPLTLQANMCIYDAIDFLLENDISGAPIVDKGGNLVGLISEKDCLKLVSKGVGHELPSKEATIEKLMTKNVYSIHPDMDIYYVAGVFLNKVYRRFPVVEDGKLAGVLSRVDVVKAIRDYLSSR
ncbi:MAG: CBS domain-containing protein [Flavobacteriales bacterium]|nr:MAG: CBS domain-containing protein [Flavobacteriales bacterium]